MKGKLIAYGIFVIIWALITNYFFMPTYTFSSSGIYWNLLMFFIISTFISFDFSEPEATTGTWISGLLSVLMMFVLIVTGLSSSDLCRAESYQKLLTEPIESEFTSNISPVSSSQMLVVDQEIAQAVGSKVLGSSSNKAYLGEFTLQVVNKKLYWIAPLLHSGYWKWSKNSEGTTGYVKVSATDQNDYQLITKKTDSSQIYIKYQPDAYFGDYLPRHIYNNGYSGELFSDYTFEVDDNWNPYWTVTLYENKIGLSGSDPTGVLVIDPQTGDIKKYSIKDAPSWIDRIQPYDLVKSQVSDWGQYVHGYFNWSNTDVKSVCENNSIVLGHDGRSYFYIGLTSAGNSTSTIGFIMVDTRTKKSFWFKQVGATEDAAKKSAEGKVQNMGYVGSDGITYNINGVATYEFLLKDKSNTMKMIGFVSVHDHTIVGVGENRNDALQDYQRELVNRNNSVSFSSSDMIKTTIKTTIKRFSSDMERGNTSYYLTVSSAPGVLFQTSSSLSKDVILSKEGDQVQITYIKVNSQPISLLDFKNLTLNVYKDSSYVSKIKDVDSTSNVIIEDKSNKVVDKRWNDLTPEQKRKALNGK